MSTDRRHFAKVDVGYFDNPKIAELLDERPRVAILHLRAILYCKQHGTDGVFPGRLLARMASVKHCSGQCAEQCVEQCDYCNAHAIGLFERIDDRSSRVHDYLKHQESAKDAEARSSKAKAAAEARWSGRNDASSNAPSIALSIASSNAEKRREEKKDIGAERADVARLCSHLADRIESNGSKRPEITNSWIKAARLLLDTDKRPEAEASHLIDWCQDSEFWRSNVLSMAKFREKYDTLRLQAIKPTQPARNTNMPEGW